MSVLLRPVQSPLGLQTGGALSSSSRTLASSQAWSLHFPGPFHTPPFTTLQSPSDLGLLTAPEAHSFIISVVDIRDKVMDKYSFELCPASGSQLPLSFCLELSSIFFFFFFPLFLHGAGGCFRSIWGIILWPLGQTSQGNLDS